MTPSNAPLDARNSDDWIVVPTGSLRDEGSAVHNTHTEPQNCSVPGRRPLQYVRSGPAALPPTSRLMMRHPSSSRRSMCNRDHYEAAASLSSLSTTGGNNRWDWTIEKLKQLPPYYHVEKTAMKFRGLSLECISKRVSNFLRVNSIPATYYGDHVECISSGFLKFVVQLWEGDSPDGIIMEVQRRTGCILQMRKLRRGIHRCITFSEHDNDETTPHFTALSSPREVPSTISSDSSLQQHHDPRRKLCAQSKKEGCQWTLQTAQRLLASKCFDQNKLGMESLISLVDLSIADPSVASCVSGSIVCGTGKYAKHIRISFSDYFHDTRLKNDNEDGFDDDDNDDDENNKDYARGRHFGRLHMLALQVLAKALTIVLDAKQHKSPSGGGSSTTKTAPSADIRSWFWRNVLEALIYNIEVADCRPVEAALSSKCLYIVMTLEPELQHCRWIEERLIPGLVYAHDFGRAHHLHLETESENLMSTLH